MNKQELLDLVANTDARKLTKIIEKGEAFDSEVERLRAQNRDLKSRDGREKFKIKFYSIFSAAIFIIILLGSLVGCPRYNVYKQTMEGKAELEKAKQNRQIKVEEAKAKNEAAISEAEAKVKMANAKNQEMVITAQGQRESDSIRAIGVARANEIIGQSLKGNKDYLQFLWIDQLDKGSQKVYIPTEAGLPILEAGK